MKLLYHATSGNDPQGLRIAGVLELKMRLVGIFIDVETESVHKITTLNTHHEFEKLKRDCTLWINRDAEYPDPRICDERRYQDEPWLHPDSSRGTLRNYDDEKN